MNKMKPCPFCKSVDLKTTGFYRGNNEGNNEYESSVECNRCQANGSIELSINLEAAKELAVKSWNMRTL